MAVDFISNKLPSWKAIQTRLQPKIKISFPKKIDLNLVHQRNLGPGCYQLEIKQKNSTQRFSDLPRFSPKERFKLLVPNFDKPKTNSIISNSDRKKQIDHRNVYMKRFKSVNCVGKLKGLIWKSRTEERLKKIKERTAKFGKWCVVKMFLGAQKGWFVFLAMCTAVRTMKIKLQFRKKLKSAFFMNSKFLYQVSRAVGRICARLKQIRKSNSLKVLGTLLIPLVNRKVSVLLTTYNERIVFCLESILTRRMLKRLYFSCKRKICTLKNRLEGLVSIYKSRCARLFDMWEKIQTKYHQNSNKLIIPVDVSMAVIRRYLFTKLKQARVTRKSTQQSTVYLDRRYLKLEFALKSFPSLRIYHQEELIRLYLEVEQQFSGCTD